MEKKARDTPSDASVWRYCNRVDQRLIWADWKARPELRPYHDLDELTDAEQLWVLMQSQIDAGLLYCPRCEEPGWSRFCGACGSRMVGHDRRWRECPSCKAEVSTDYCGTCGYPVVDQVVRSYESGDEDFFEAEADMADAMLSRIFAQRPDLAPVSHPIRANVVEAINVTFGRRNG